MRFTKEQQKFINFTAPRLLLEAPAGSGKTETVAERVRVKVAEGKTVQLTCFTNAAKHTLQKRLDEAGVHLTVRTIDSLAREILLNELGDLFDVGDGLSIASEVCARTPVKPKDLKQLEDLIASGAPLPDTLPSVTAEVFEAYEARKAELNYLTFSDCVLAATGLRDFGWDELIVDEAQDCSPKHLKMLTSFGAKNLTFVGDSLQAIFGFSGVDTQLFAKLKNDGWERLSLTKSFRVPAGILPVVNAVRDELMVAHRDGGSYTSIQTTHAETAEKLEQILRPGDCVLGLTAGALTRVFNRLKVHRPDVPLSTSWSGGVDDDSIHLSTIHKAKGGQWNRVFVLGVGGSGGLWTPMDTDTETLKMLFYVACSRATDELFLCHRDDELPWGLSND